MHNNASIKMKLSVPDERDDGGCIGIYLVTISKVFVVQGALFFGTKTLVELRPNSLKEAFMFVL